VAVLTSPYCPDFDPHRLAMAICVGYFRPARARETAGTYSVSGFVSSKARWREFETRWSKVLRHEGLKAFHAGDFTQGRGEFIGEWAAPARRRNLLNLLGRTLEQHIFRAFSQSVNLEAFRAVNADYALTEATSGPYGLCAAFMIARVRRWMTAKYPDNLTLFVFEDGEMCRCDLQPLLKAVGAERGEPVQTWPTQWVDERGRRRYLRPLEAGQLFDADQEGLFAGRLTEHLLLESQTLDREQLARICEALKLPSRRTTHSEEKRAVVTR